MRRGTNSDLRNYSGPQYQRWIIQLLREQRIPLTMRICSQKLNIPENAARNALHDLVRQGKLTRERGVDIGRPWEYMLTRVSTAPSVAPNSSFAWRESAGNNAEDAAE